MGGAWAATYVTSSKPALGDGSSSNPFQISNAKELAWFRDWVNGTYTPEDGETATTHPNACTKLTDNIDMSTVCGENIGSWEPINNWYGTFDGDGHNISNLYIKGDYRYTGLFGNLKISGSRTATIKNIILDNVYIINTSSTLSDSYNGILVGYGSNLTINNVSILSGELVNKTVKGTDHFYGGIVGESYGGIIIRSCTNHARIQGGNWAGGICGYFCANTNAKTITIDNCTNYGDISGSDTGGITGYAKNSAITNCANYGNLTGSSRVGGIIGYLTKSSVKNCLTSGNVSYSSTFDAYGLVVGKADDITLSYIAYSSEATLKGEANGKVIGIIAYTATDPTSECTAYTPAQMKSGEVAYKLNGEKSEGDDLAWYQVIGTDDYPVLTQKEDGIVYYVQTFDCSKEQYTDVYEYLNVASKFNHNMMAEGHTELDTDRHIYYTGCQRRACELHKYFADPNATLEAQKQSDGSFNVGQMALTDGEAYDSQAEFTAQQLSYSRSFAHDKWQALYVPFETKVTEELLNDFDLAAPNNLHEYELADGNPKVVLEAKKMKSGYTIKALRPYLIRAKEAGEKSIQLTNCPLKGATEDSYVDCSSVLRHYKFIGTLKGKNSFDTTADFVLSEGKLIGSEADTQLKAMRWYLNATDRDTDMGILPDSGNAGIGGGADGGNGSTQASRSIDITIVDDDATTGIDDISVITEQASGSVAASRRGIFDLQGRKLSQEPQSGVYIKDGKKMVK